MPLTVHGAEVDDHVAQKEEVHEEVEGNVRRGLEPKLFAEAELDGDVDSIVLRGNSVRNVMRLVSFASVSRAEGGRTRVLACALVRSLSGRGLVSKQVLAQADSPARSL